MQGEVVVKGKAPSESGCCKRGDVPVAQNLDSCDLLGQAKFAGPWGTVVREVFRAKKTVENELQSRRRQALKSHVDQGGRRGYYRLGIRNRRANGSSGFCSCAAAQKVVGRRQQARKTSVRLAPCTGEAGLGGKGGGQCPPPFPRRTE
jgi:hypothetical protein